ncbi:tryptophan transporter [Fictibacillus iocasae]|uniref:Tryptophan transporter n=1 Tax=Fictibacillus iocasae TaxID=2715437 RepID=A0ABW2NUB1_9BACL
MNTKSLAFTGVLLALGYVLHTIVPPFFLGMKPDMLLTMMFLAIMINPQKGNVVMASLGAGMISALTTGFPGGQLANIIEKPLTAFIFFFFILALSKLKQGAATAALLTAAGTIVSGVLFLSAALLIASLPGPFTALVLTVVLPAAGFNAALMAVLYPIASKMTKRMLPAASVR